MALPTIILPGYFAPATDYFSLETDLNQLGIPTITVPLRQRDWWPTLGGRSIVPIVRQIDRTVQEMRQKYQVDRVNLVAHSAGGWIARIYMGEYPYTIHNDVTPTEGLWQAHSHIATLITLGTPHQSQEYWTRKNLNFVNDNYPGAFYPTVKYICVAGKAVYGRPLKNWFTFNSYQLTCGNGNTWGDGIVPIASAHLEGALNLTLEGVLHAPTSPGLWYGSPEPLKAWLEYLL